MVVNQDQSQAVVCCLMGKGRSGGGIGSFCGGFSGSSGSSLSGTKSGPGILTSDPWEHRHRDQQAVDYLQVANQEVVIISPLLFYKLDPVFARCPNKTLGGASTSSSRDQRQDMEVGPNLHRCILIVFVHSLFVV